MNYKEYKENKREVYLRHLKLLVNVYEHAKRKDK